MIFMNILNITFFQPLLLKKIKIVLASFAAEHEGTRNNMYIKFNHANFFFFKTLIMHL